MAQIVFLLVLLAAINANENGKNNKDGNGIEDPSTNLYNLGRVGNKYYFVVRDPRMNWPTARTYCQEHGMTLASIDTEQELSFLQSSYILDVFHGSHWTAARDVRTLQQFVWDDTRTNITVSIPLVGAELPLGNYPSCGTFTIDPGRSGMSFRACSQDNGYTLCEAE